MNKKFLSIFGASGLAVMVALAANGTNLVKALEAAFLFMLKMGDKAPLGLASFALTMALAIGAQAFLHKFAGQLFPCSKSRDALYALAGFAIATSVMYLQLRTLNGLLLGLLAGFASPFAYQLAGGLWSLVVGPPVDPAKKEPLDE